jgi:hypothetical protein
VKKILMALMVTSLVAVTAEAEAGGWHGGYHGGYHGYHGGYYGGSNFWWGAAFGAALTVPFYYAYSRSYDTGPYYYYNSAPTVYVNPPVYVQSQPVYVNPPVYVQSQPVYVQSQPNYVVAAPQPRNTAPQAPAGVTELGPANGGTPPTVALANPQELAPPQPAQSGKWFVYPGKGQSPARLAADRSQCNAWAVGESGFDPDLKVHRNPETGPNDYGRALSACLEGRGYTVR